MDFWALIFGLMFTLFGGFALCYGIVKLLEGAVKSFRAKHSPVAVPADPTCSIDVSADEGRAEKQKS